MPGFYDNEHGCYVDLYAQAAGDWYDQNGMLFIIPKAGAVAEIEGPDGETLDKLNALCRKHDPKNPPRAEVEALGLRYVDDCLKRFDPMTGYYHA